MAFDCADPWQARLLGRGLLLRRDDGHGPGMNRWRLRWPAYRDGWPIRAESGR